MQCFTHRASSSKQQRSHSCFLEIIVMKKPLQLFAFIAIFVIHVINSKVSASTILHIKPIVDLSILVVKEVMVTRHEKYDVWIIFSKEIQRILWVYLQIMKVILKTNFTQKVYDTEIFRPTVSELFLLPCSEIIF